MFYDLLNIKEPEWHQTFIDGRRLTSKTNNNHLFSKPDFVSNSVSTTTTALATKQ